MEPISVADAELSEAEALFDFEAAAPERACDALGIDAIRVGGGVALSVRRDPSRFWSKVLGLGVESPITLELVETVRDFYRACGTPVTTFQIAPSLLPDDWEEICARVGLSAAGAWIKLACPVEAAVRAAADPDRPPPRVTVGPVQATDASAWASAVLRGFGMPDDGIGEMAAASVGRPGWHAFAAWDDAELVATGTLYVRGAVGQLLAAATLPHARRRGAQSAILAARARAAQSAGCRWLVAETGVEPPDGHNSSLHNMLRLGFEVLYARPNWTWQAQPSR
ncbi:MAG TPA: GNAT family N-acetyltransferase [Conexibacter sp.]|jgi:GNAT superfamily N-acetyltransferase